MSERLPSPSGEWIDRDQLVTFRYEGRGYRGFAGDTISTALWANGVRVLGRSFKYHRPRGIFSLAGADSNAMMEDQSGRTYPADTTAVRDGMDLRATNTMGGAERDWLSVFDRLSAFIPVGFYYKAFHTPKRLFPFYENQIRKVAGLGSIRPESRFSGSPKDYDFCDVLVVGAGPSGLAAAVSAAELGAQVLLVDENRYPGGTLNFQTRGRDDAQQTRAALLEQIHKAPNIRLRTSTNAAGCYSDHWVALVDDRRLTKLRARSIVVASGCYEHGAAFRNNDLPGVMLASAAQRLVHLFAVRPFERVVLVTANLEGYQAALDLHHAGVQLAAVADLRTDGETSALSERVANLGVAVHNGSAIYEAVPSKGKRGVQEAILCRLDAAGQPSPQGHQMLACDGIAMSVGWMPADNLLRQAGAKMKYQESVEQFVPTGLPPGVLAAGRVNGVYDLQQQLEDGRRAGQEAAVYLGLKYEMTFSSIEKQRSCHSHPYPIVSHPKGKNFVDLDEDLQEKDFYNAAQEGFDNPELLKRYTAVGMGPSQGKHSNLLAVRILSRIRGESMAEKQLTTSRPFTAPVPLGHLAGRIFTPIRRTPLHGRHVAAGARFLHAGAWLRPEYYQSEGRTRDESIALEARNVRAKVGLIDVGTLGKLEISGPGAVEFLERIYTGVFSTLKVGRSRYALMCDEGGIVIDDGMVARLGEDRYYVSTTSTGSEAVYREMQRWALRWSLEVYLTNATYHFGAMNLAGPLSRKLLDPLTDIGLEPESFPYLGVREGIVAGVPARVSRIGFVGELGYEIHVPYDGAVRVWDCLIDAGQKYGIQPFGVEAQRVLRLEKSHLIVSQDTDGLTNPYEAGTGWAVKMQKSFFVGGRSLSILKKKKQSRQLVGFTLPKAYKGPIPKECHLIIDEGQITGRVTSVTRSPTLGQVIGLAYVPPSQSTPGTSIRIRVDSAVVVQAEVAETPFYDPQNNRQKPTNEGQT